MSENENKPYAVVKTSGQQLRLSAGDKIVVNRVASDVGATVTFSEVLAVSSAPGEIKIGTPLIAGATVTAKVVSHSRGKKVEIFKKRRRKGYTKSQGFRQELSTLVVESIA